MCGIAGILDKRGGPTEVLQSRLRALTESLRHRGPDASGTWTEASGKVGLAHTRLAILDLSAAGNQPMSTPDGRLHVVFNGEIYNFQELRAGLESQGIEFRSSSDTEVLLRLYERDGCAMLSQLRGMFAFAIWDSRHQRCLLARDPLGIKPLYYSMAGPQLAFASELHALQEQGLTGKEIDATALLEYLKTGSVPEPMTLLQDCHCLEAGHYLIWQDARITKRRYFQFHHDYNLMPQDEAARSVRASLLNSVEAHFVSDVPVGVFLSGGIDSTAIVALASHLGREKLDTFSVSVNDPLLDEGDTAEQTARHFGTRHHKSRIDAQRARHSFDAFLKCADQPSIDGFNTYLVSAAAHEQGVKVVLSGLGGDEIFGGYKSFDVVPPLARLGQMAGYTLGLRHAAGRLMEWAGADTRLRRIGSFLRSDITIAAAHTCFRGVFSTHDARRVAAQYLECSVADIPEEHSAPVEVANLRDAVSECELRFYMRNQLLKDSDVMSMAHGLELRVPFVDSTLIESVGHIHPALRLRKGKKMLLEAVPEIPAWVRCKPKQGFVFPFETWLSQEWEDSFAAATLKIPFSKATWYQRWAVFMLDAWLRRHHLT